MTDSIEVAELKAEIAKVEARNAEMRARLAKMDARKAKRHAQAAKVRAQIAEATTQRDQLRGAVEELERIHVSYEAHQRVVQLATPPSDWLPNEDAHDGRGADLLDALCDDVVMHTYRLRKLTGWWPQVDEVIKGFAAEHCLTTEPAARVIARELDRPNSRLTVDVDGGLLLVVVEDQHVRDQLDTDVAHWHAVDDQRLEALWRECIEDNPDPLGINARREAWKEAHG
jgi:hypothetical protein